MATTRGRKGTGARRTPPLAPDLVVLGRYRLADRVADSDGMSLWRAMDERLRRPVGVRFLALDSPLAEDLRREAAAASHVTDRHAVPVLDIDADLVTERLVVVTEWVTGSALGDLLASRGEPMPAREAAALALEVARFLAAADEAGVPHGRVRPNCVIVTDSGEVRVRGLGVDRVLYGIEPPGDAQEADVDGAGAVLYACLTGRWPTAEGVDGMPGVPSLERGRVPWPSRVRADVPRELDEVAARALRTSVEPRGRGRYGSVAEVAAALTSALRPDQTPVARSGAERWRPFLRVASVLFFTAAAVGLGGLGVSLVLGLDSPPVNAPRTESASPLPSDSPSASTSTAPGQRVVPVVSARDFDPYGNQSENPKQAALAIDGKPSTAWKTVRYKTSDLSGKPGVGLMLDLGAPRPVSAVELRLVGNGTDVSIRATDDPTKKPEDMRALADVTGAGNQLRPLRWQSVTTRYVLIWLTALPTTDGAYQGGIAEVRLLG